MKNVGLYDCLTKAGLTLNGLYDTTCMTHNRFSNFHCVYTIIQVVHAELIKMFYSTFKSSSKMIQELDAAAVIIALISEKNKSRKKRVRGSLCETLA